jgi:hypothetical protein
MTNRRLRRSWALTCAAATLLVGAVAHAQAGGGASGSPPPVRATSTVEVIDVGRGVDDIISRVRAQQRTQDAPVPPAAAGSKATASGARTGQRQAAKAGDGHTHEADDLRAERPERPRIRPEHDHHDGHHADRDLGRHSQVERAREGRK